MANEGTLRICLEGLWSEEAFQSFFATPWNKILRKVELDKYAKADIESHMIASVLNKYAPQNAKQCLSEEFLNMETENRLVYCVLSEKDSVTVYCRYTVDQLLASALAALFPEREIQCDYFIDGQNVSGHYTIRNMHIEDKQEYEHSEIQEDDNVPPCLELCDTFTGNEYLVTFEVHEGEDEDYPLCVVLWSYEGEGMWGVLDTATTYFPGEKPTDKDCAFIDVFNVPYLPQFLLETGLAEPTGGSILYCGCDFPEYRFNREMLAKYTLVDHPVGLKVVDNINFENWDGSEDDLPF